MEDKQLQSIRYKLQKRVRRLNSASWEQFMPFLRQFFAYFNSSPILCGVRDDLVVTGQKHNVKDTVDKILSGGKLLYARHSSPDRISPLCITGQAGCFNVTRRSNTQMSSFIFSQYRLLYRLDISHFKILVLKRKMQKSCSGLDSIVRWVFTCLVVTGYIQ